MKVYSEYFYGNKISNYGLENGYVDYGTLAKSFNHILCNEIATIDIDMDMVSGTLYDEETEDYFEIFQYYLIDKNGVDVLREINEVIFYIDKLDLYVWGVTHYGTSWDYVLTDIKIEKGERP